ncbi:ParA family protein [Oscillospiraceae bacterium MB08-C2-2]|nr:ParA family protein [Oscillospiraceae bacterium MB08-C2-2]
MAKHIFFGNYKGGVGKTTTVFELGALLAKNHKKKVLLVDLDPQASLSKVCANTTTPKVTLENIDVQHTLNFLIELYAEYMSSASRIQILESNISTNSSCIVNAIRNIKKYSKSGGCLDYIPTVLDLKNSRLNDISERLSVNTVNVLAIPQMLKDIAQLKDDGYDYILFDCPPTSNLIIQSVFLACDYYLIPTVGDEISTDGVADYITEIESTYLRFAYDENIGGMLLKMYFSDRPQLIGILETIFKSRRPSPANTRVLEALDVSVSSIGVKSLITGTPYVSAGRKHIFKEYIRHLDNRSDPNNYGIPITLSNGDIHQEYAPIADAIAALI